MARSRNQCACVDVDDAFDVKTGYIVLAVFEMGSFLLEVIRIVEHCGNQSVLVVHGNQLAEAAIDEDIARPELAIGRDDRQPAAQRFADRQ